MAVNSHGVPVDVSTVAMPLNVRMTMIEAMLVQMGAMMAAMPVKTVMAMMAVACHAVAVAVAVTMAV
jgi:hypothetical protein